MRAMLVIVLAAGCGAALQGMQGKNGEALTDTIKSYNEDVKWERWDNASAFIPATQRATRVDEWDERAHELKITDFEIIKVDRKGDEARAHVKLEWYRTSDNTVHETHAVQTWEHKGKGWLVVDESRLRGPEMPGLPEPMMHDDKPAPRTR